MARRSRYTPQTHDRIVAAVAAGLTLKDAAATAGVHEMTLHRWLRRHPRLAEALEGAKAQRTLRWLGTLARAAEHGDWRAAAELLDRCAPDYRKAARLEQAVTVDIRRAAEVAAAELGLPVDVVLAETYKLAERASARFHDEEDERNA